MPFQLNTLTDDEYTKLVEENKKSLQGAQKLLRETIPLFEGGMEELETRIASPKFTEQEKQAYRTELNDAKIEIARLKDQNAFIDSRLSKLESIKNSGDNLVIIIPSDITRDELKEGIKAANQSKGTSGKLDAFVDTIIEKAENYKDKIDTNSPLSNINIPIKLSDIDPKAYLESIKQGNEGISSKEFQAINDLKGGRKKDLKSIEKILNDTDPSGLIQALEEFKENTNTNFGKNICDMLMNRIKLTERLVNNPSASLSESSTISRNTSTDSMSVDSTTSNEMSIESSNSSGARRKVTFAEEHAKQKIDTSEKHKKPDLERADSFKIKKPGS